jgi:hypothetical protein
LLPALMVVLFRPESVSSPMGCVQLVVSSDSMIGFQLADLVSIRFGEGR